MKQLLFILLTASPSLLFAQGDKETPYMTKSLSSEAVKNVELQTSGGSLSVTASSASEARLEVYVRDNHGDKLSNEEAKQRIDERYDLTISVSGNKLTAIAKQKKDFNDWKRALSISFRVFVPKDVSTDLSTSGGSISIKGLNGKQDFSTSGGSLHVEGVSGKIYGRTSGGSIHVQNSSDDIDLTTSGGSIHADNCSGKLRLNTSGGTLNLNQLKGEIKATTSGGGVKGSAISGELAAHTSGGSIRLYDLSCSLETSTSGGSIDVAVTTMGKYIKIRNSGGNIDLELPKGKGLDLDISGDKVKVDELSNFKGKTKEGEIEGTVNGGGIPVDVKSGSGRVSLAFK